MMHYEGYCLRAEGRAFEGLYLAVDFFFVLSGFFLYRTVKMQKYENAWAFTFKRVKEFIGYNVLMILLFMISNLYKTLAHTQLSIGETISVCWRIVLNEVYEFFFLQMFLPSEMDNFPIWYISVLLVVGYCLYLLLDKHKNAIDIIPVIAIVVYMWLYMNYGVLDLHISSETINPGILRGIADMCLGITGYAILEKIHIRGNAFIRIILLWAMATIMLCFPNTELDYVFPCLALLCILNEFSCTTQRDYGKLCGYLRRLSISMYFVHTFIIRMDGLQQKIYEVVQYKFTGAIIVEFFVFVVASIVLDMCVQMLGKMWRICITKGLAFL